MAGSIKSILNAVVVICVVFWLLFGKTVLLIQYHPWSANSQRSYTGMRELEVLGNNHLKLDLADCKDFFEQELVEQVRIPECKSPKGQASLLRPERMATDMPERFSWRGRCKWRPRQVL